MQSNSDTIILAIETSCDETSASLVKNGRDLMSLETYTQIQTHAEYGGVVPEVASRMHIETLTEVINSAIGDFDKNKIDAIAVTQGPGLVGALLVGVSFAKAMSYALKVPLIGVHHIDGHISANYITNKKLEPPFLSLVVSGGHTMLVMVRDYGEYELIGQTRDDAAGEAFDKGARLLGLAYPGGKVLDDLAKTGNKEAVKFTRSKIIDAPFDFSFSGIKTQLRHYTEKMGEEYMSTNINDIAASYQYAIVDMLMTNLRKAVREYDVKKVALAGGVAANSSLRAAVVEMSEKENVEIFVPELKLCADNAAMIGAAAYYMLKKGSKSDIYLNAMPQWELYDKKYKK